MNVYLPNLRLPSAYQEVEYIQSSGTQYINTGYKASNNTKIEISMGGWSSVQRFQCVFGCREAYSSTGKGFQLGYDTQYMYNGMFNKAFDIQTTLLSFIDGNNYVIQMSQDGIYQNGTKKYTISSATFTSPVNMTLFALNDNGTVKEYGLYKMYYTKIWDNGTLVRDFVPCYRKSDSVIGLYDLVNNQFYTNAGTGTFSKGNDVTMAELKNAYIGEVWTPGSNTIAYFPLAEDGLDKTGNYTLSNTGTATTGNLGRRFTSNCLLTTTPTGVKTILAWVKPNTIPTGSSFQTTITVLRCIDRNVSFLLSSGGSPASYVPCFYVYYSGADRYGGSKLMTAGNWYLVAMTTDSKVLGYINGTEYTIYNGTIGQTITDASLLKADSLSPDVVLSEVILENKVWTQAEIQDYYNLTKSNYGL